MSTNKKKLRRLNDMKVMFKRYPGTLGSSARSARSVRFGSPTPFPRFVPRPTMTLAVVQIASGQTCTTARDWPVDVSHTRPMEFMELHSVLTPLDD